MAKRLRDYNLAMLLLATSAVLAAVLFYQWHHFRGKQSDLKKMLATKVETRMEAQKLPEQHFELPGLEDYTATIERPLFREGRRPAAPDTNEPESAPVEKKPLAVKLMGVVFAPKGIVGLFVDAQGKYKRLRINDSIGGWKVVGIEHDKAVMEQDGVKEDLKLFKPKQKKSAGQPKLGGGQPVPGQFVPGQPMPGQPMPGQQQMPPFGTFNPNNPNPTEEPFDTEQPNEAIDQTAFPPEEPTNEQ